MFVVNLDKYWGSCATLIKLKWHGMPNGDGLDATLFHMSSNSQQLLQPAAGSYRQLQTRLRANAESVAAYGGIQKDGGLIESSFKKVVRHRAQLLQTQWLFSMWQVSPLSIS